MISYQSIRTTAQLAVLGVLSMTHAYAAQPTRFTFTPTFKDPDPGKRQWVKERDRYIEKLPSGRLNNFKVQKYGEVHGLKGTILQKIEEPNFFVFVADSNAEKPELWWWRDKGPWKFMGLMREISVPMTY